MGNSIKPHLKNAEKTGVLQLCNTGITDFPRELLQLSSVLRTLDLSENKIGVLPSSIGNFVNIKNLSLSQTRLSVIPGEIGQLKKLESVNFSVNNLTTLPSSFSQLVNLRTINLSRNHLTVFPAVFTGMKRLELLDMSHNRLTDVTDIVSEMSVTEMNLNQNQIAALSQGIADCQRLKVLRLEENCLQLHAIPEKILRDSQISLLALDGNLFGAKDLQERDGYEQYMERFTATKKKLF